MSEIREKFYERLKSRNENQLRAITTINGPVMVIAGPGTGKTDVLGLRIGYILENTDTDIHNILCLTYTEAGAVEMRKRLLEYVGPDAYNAQVYTFHGFCNMVIHENIELFGVFREHQPVSELEQFQILKEIIDMQPMDHPLKRYTGQIYYETRRLRALYDTMKLEQWSPADMHAAIDKWEAEMEESPEFRYKRSTTRGGVTFVKGDLKIHDFEKKVKTPMELLRSAVDTFDTYNELLRQKGRYDYHDMLTWVHDRFRENDSLLARYQERFQYFLVDEFQDSNGIQMALLNLLLSQWGEQSDVFIVGDDDQSIFRFQGALMKNILEFKDQYDPEVVVLTDNYRSTQSILDAASDLIKCNEERLVVQFPEYTKELRAQSPHADLDLKPEVHVYPNSTQEAASLLKELSDIYDNGVLKNETVAVIYRRHSQVEDIVHALEVREIPINVKRPVNILERPLIRNVLLIMEYLSLELEEYGAGEHLLYPLMQLPYFGISARDAGVLAFECRKMRKAPRTFWREVMADRKLLENIGIKDVDAILAFDSRLSSWIEKRTEYTLQELLEYILTHGGILERIFTGPNRSWHLQIVKTFFDFVKDQSKRMPDISLKKFLEDIALMKEHGIELSVHKILTASRGIHFVTAHSAKGMQFDRVYMIGCTKNVWDGKYSGGNDFKLPQTLSPISATGNEEDERRLFYVGMTRARKHLTMSYPLLDDNEREQEASRFVQEVLDGGDVRALDKELSEIDFAHFCIDLMRPLEVRVPLIDQQLLDQVLENFVLSVSALNVYLECPRKFYFEKILRIPSARKAYFGFGNAVHSALEQFFIWHVADHKVNGTAEDLVSYFNKYLKKNKAHFTRQEYELHEHLGNEMLKTYFEQRVENWKIPQKSELELRIDHAEHKGVPLKGFLDRLDFFKDMVAVTDYKTGKASNARKKMRPPKQEGEVGGDYWRQLVFYKILIDAAPQVEKPMPVGYLDFVRPSSDGTHKLEKVIITDEDEAVVSDQIVETYRKIMNHEFDAGCEEPDCEWCNLVKSQASEEGVEVVMNNEQ